MANEDFEICPECEKKGWQLKLIDGYCYQCGYPVSLEVFQERIRHLDKEVYKKHYEEFIRENQVPIVIIYTGEEKTIWLERTGEYRIIESDDDWVEYVCYDHPIRATSVNMEFMKDISFPILKELPKTEVGQKWRNKENGEIVTVNSDEEIRILPIKVSCERYLSEAMGGKDNWVYANKIPYHKLTFYSLFDLIDEGNNDAED